MRLLVHLLSFGICVGMFAFAITTYDELPDQFPTHFNMEGEADQIAAKSWGMWLLLPSFGVGLIAFVYGCGWLVHWLILRKPEMVNLPQKARLIEMTPDQRRPIANAMSLLMYGMAVPCGGLILYLQIETLRVARDPTQPMEQWAFWITMLVLTVMVVAGIVVSVRRVREAVEADTAAKTGSRSAGPAE